MKSRGANDPAYVLERIRALSTGDALLGRRCFTCSGASSTGAGEHVFPRWLQRKYALNNEKLQLLNGSLIPYRQLTIPCCDVCNTGFLSKLEKQVRAIEGNCLPLSSPQRLALAQWLAKILVGIMIKESAIPYDRANPEGGHILPSTFLENFYHAQLLLQTARKNTTFAALHNEFPFTLYSYGIEEDDRFGSFDLFTSVVGQSVAIRMGSVGAIFVNDGGLQHHVGMEGPFDLNGRCLHPVQFSEIAARVHYKSMLCVATHAYQTVETPNEIHIEQLDVVPFSKERLPDGSWKIFEPWDDKECATLVTAYRRWNYGPVLDGDTGKLLTTLVDANGRARAATDFLSFRQDGRKTHNDTHT